MEENNKNEQEIAEFQNWLEKNNWVFNEQLEMFINKEKKEMKTNDDLLLIFEEEKLVEEEKKKKQEEVQIAFDKFLSENGWEVVDKKTAKNKKGETKAILDLVEDFKVSIQKSKETKTESTASKKTTIQKSEIPEDVKRYEEKEGLKKLREHKYKGTVTRHDINPKLGLMKKRVKLYDKNNELQEDFYFETSYEVK